VVSTKSAILALGSINFSCIIGLLSSSIWSSKTFDSSSKSIPNNSNSSCNMDSISQESFGRSLFETELLSLITVTRSNDSVFPAVMLRTNAVAL